MTVNPSRAENTNKLLGWIFISTGITVTINRPTYPPVRRDTGLPAATTIPWR
jgi:hypothetical protein